MPTFRHVETGLWAKVDPYEISSADGWRRHPEKVWAWYLWRHYMMKAVEPNDGHRAVAAWQDSAEVHVVTQKGRGYGPAEDDELRLIDSAFQTLAPIPWSRSEKRATRPPFFAFPKRIFTAPRLDAAAR